ncbi:MAG TPA: DM13 domain-containing protein, partial [Phototrophicaceae bacterium]|nr:DM13 domain-containing protein [Phototrophicaceae bacterium]
PSLVSPVIVASGTFQQLDAIRYGQGTVTIYQDASNALTLRLDDSFSMQNGPDLHISLSAADTPKTPEDLSVGGVDPVDVGGLKATLKAQNYQLPDGVDLTQFRTAVIYSTSLDLIYTYAPLFVRQ